MAENKTSISSSTAAPSFDKFEISQRGWNDVPVLAASNSVPPAPIKKRTSYAAVQSLAGTAILDSAAPPMSSTPPTALSQPPIATKIAENESVDQDAVLAQCSEIKTALMNATDALVANGKLPARQAEDTTRRLQVLYSLLDAGSLSSPVRVLMHELATALSESRAAAAFELHTKIVMNYTQEVSAWMIAVKKIVQLSL